MTARKAAVTVNDVLNANSLEEIETLLRALPPDDFTTKEALQMSIRKWEIIADDLEAGNEPSGSLYGATCACCHKFYDDDYDEETSLLAGCDACPIAQSTGVDDCGSTPFVTFMQTDSGSEAEIEAARAEITFLQELLNEQD